MKYIFDVDRNNANYSGRFEFQGIGYAFSGNWVPCTAGEQQLKVWQLDQPASDRLFIIPKTATNYGYFCGINVFEQLEAKLQGLDPSAIAKYSD